MQIKAMMSYSTPTRWLASRNLTVSMLSKGMKEPIEKIDDAFALGRDMVMADEI